jgi:nitric oxide reductase NorD protein
MPAENINSEALTEALAANMRLDQFEESEISSVVRDIGSISDRQIRMKVISLCHALSRISSTLVPKSLKHILHASELLVPEDLVRWLERSLEILDSSGLREFVLFMVKDHAENLRPFMNPEFPTYHGSEGTLELYLRGITGRDLSVAPDHESYTDLKTVYLPRGISSFPDHNMNLTLYEFMAVHKWAEIALKTLEAEPSDSGSGDAEISDFEGLFERFKFRDLAVDLYSILEAFLIDTFLSKELPGLMRRVADLKTAEFAGRPALGDLSEKTAFVEAIYQYYLTRSFKGLCPQILATILPDLVESGTSLNRKRLVSLLVSFYSAAENTPGEYNPERPFFFFGTIRPDRISERRSIREEEKKRKVREILLNLVSFLRPHDLKKLKKISGKLREDQEYLLLRGMTIETDDGVKDAVRQGLSGAVVVTGKEIKGDPVIWTIDEVHTGVEETKERKDGYKYDEWDYRRGDYKRKWCTVYEVDSETGDESFIEFTIGKYAGIIKQLRDRFELLRPDPKLAPRNREGDMIDLEAAVNAYADRKAGLAPDENLFFRMEKKTRDMAVLFLVDMSESTKGWVTTAEKEALIILCEAFEKLGDRYAISGFSGTSRSECSYFKIKTFAEAYSFEVKRRISGIEPKAYTRMGPPIRHSHYILSRSDARRKILFIISDGRPQDIAGYSGDYAIEDTRMSLIELKKKGIIPICITMDREAKAYIPHMYGDANYFIIDDPGKLPRKITEIYSRIAF